MAAPGRPGDMANNTSDFAPLSWRAAGRVRSVTRRASDSSKSGRGTYKAGSASPQEDRRTYAIAQIANFTASRTYMIGLENLHD